jgi:hypothetical protein
MNKYLFKKSRVLSEESRLEMNYRSGSYSFCILFEDNHGDTESREFHGEKGVRSEK